MEHGPVTHYFYYWIQQATIPSKYLLPFRKAFSRYIQILENKLASGDTSIGLLELIDLKSGRKAVLTHTCLCWPKKQ